MSTFEVYNTYFGSELTNESSGGLRTQFAIVSFVGNNERKDNACARASATEPM